MAVIQKSTNKRMDKENAEYNGILFSHKKGWSSYTCYKVDKAWNHYAKWKKPDTKGQIPYDSIYMIYPKQVNPKRQKVEERLSEEKILYEVMKMF